MTHRILPSCTMCGACYDECPSDAVNAVSPSFSIDPDHCDDCEFCTDVCSVFAITAD